VKDEKKKDICGYYFTSNNFKNFKNFKHFGIYPQDGGIYFFSGSKQVKCDSSKRKKNRLRFFAAENLNMVPIFLKAKKF